MAPFARPSEDGLFEAVRNRTASSITDWIASSDFTVPDRNDLLDVLRRASSLIMARSSAKAEVKRQAFLDAIRAALVAVQGPGAGAALDKTGELLRLAEDGYRRILAALATTDYAKLAPEVRISAALARGAQQAIHNQTDIANLIAGQGAVYVQSLSLRDDFNRPVSPDAIMDAIVESASATLNLEGRGQKWVDPDDVIVIPPMVAVTEDERIKAGSNEFLSIAWRNWGLLEEKVRFLGGHLSLRSRPDVPSDFPLTLDDLFQPIGAPTCFDTWVAQNRLNDGSAQSYMQLLAAPGLKAATVELKIGAALPPLNVVSHAEGVSFSALEQTLGYSLATDPNEIDGLRIVEWLRGLSVLSVLTTRAVEAEPENPDAWLVRFDKAVLVDVLMRNGLTQAKAETFVDQARFRTRSVDLYDAPLIQCADNILIGFGPALVGINAAGALLSIFSRKEIAFGMKGKSFETRVLALLKQNDLNAEAYKTSRNGEEYEYDALLLWGDYLFLLECKNRSLPYDNPVRVRNFQRETRKQVRQVQRLRAALDQWPDIVEEALGESLGGRTIVPVVLNNLPFARSGATDGVYFYDFQALSRFFVSRALTIQMATGATFERSAKVNAAKLWRGASPEPTDLLAELEDPIQIRVNRGLTRVSELTYQLDEKTIVSEPRLFREDMTPEAIGQALGIPRHVMKTKVRALRKRLEKQKRHKR